MNVGLLKEKNFSLLVLGNFVSLFGTLLQSFALSLYVLDRTGSATSFATVTAISVLPRIFLGPVAGVLSDWFNRKKIIVSLDFLSGIVVAIFAFIFYVKGEFSTVDVYVLTIILSLISTFFGPAASTILPSIIKKENLVDANSIFSFVNMVPSFMAMIIGGILYGILGLFPMMIINSISFILSAISEIFIDIPNVTKRPKEITSSNFKNDFMEGIKFIRTKPIILSMLFLALILNFVLSPIFGIGVPFILRERFNVSSQQYGLLRSISLIAMFLSPILASKVCKKFKVELLVINSMLLNSVLIIIMSFASANICMNIFGNVVVPIASITVISFLSTLLIGITNISLTITSQKIIPLDMMGRIGSIMGTLCVAAVPLGQMVFGFMFDTLEPWVCILIGAIISFITISFFRSFLKVNTEDIPDLNISE